MEPHLENQPFRFFGLPPELRLRVYDYMTRRIIIDEDRRRLRIVASDLPLVPILLANRQLAGEYKQQWKRTYAGGISLNVLQRGRADLRWPYAVPRKLRSRVVTCYVFYPLECEDSARLIPDESLRAVDYERLHDTCEDQRKLSGQDWSAVGDADDKGPAENYISRDQHSQDEGLAQLARPAHYDSATSEDEEHTELSPSGGYLGDGSDDDDDDDDYDPEDECNAVSTLINLTIDLVVTEEPLAKFQILENLHFVMPMWWECDSQLLRWPEMPHGSRLKRELQPLVACKKTTSCIILRATSKHDYEDWICGRRKLETYAVYTKEKGWREGMASDNAKR